MLRKFKPDDAVGSMEARALQRRSTGALQIVRELCEAERLSGEQAIDVLCALQPEDLEEAAFLLLDACRERHVFLEACLLLSSKLTSIETRGRQLPQKSAAAVLA